MAKSFLKFIGKWMLIFVLGSLIAFFITRSMPGNPVDMLLGRYGLSKTPENVAAIENRFMLNEPWHRQYISWVTDFVKGEWGNSYITRSSLKPEILRRLPISVGIGMGGTILAAILAFFIGYGASLKEKGFWNYISKGITIFNQAVPVFLMILVVIYFFGVKYRLVRFFSGDGMVAMIMGMIFIAFPLLGPMSRTVRVHFLETLEKPYMDFYIYSGYERNKALLLYGSRPAIYGLCSVVVSRFAWVLGGGTVVEFALGIHGISLFLIDSIAQRDYLLIQTYIMTVIIWMAVVHFIFGFIFERILYKGGVE